METADNNNMIITCKNFGILSYHFVAFYLLVWECFTHRQSVSLSCRSLLCRLYVYFLRETKDWFQRNFNFFSFRIEYINTYLYIFIVFSVSLFSDIKPENFNHFIYFAAKFFDYHDEEDDDSSSSDDSHWAEKVVNL